MTEPATSGLGRCSLAATGERVSASSLAVANLAETPRALLVRRVAHARLAAAELLGAAGACADTLLVPERRWRIGPLAAARRGKEA